MRIFNIFKKENKQKKDLKDNYVLPVLYTNLYDSKKVDSYPNDFIVVDTETTGLKPHSDRIIEISAIKYVNRIKVDTFNYLININEPIPEYITRLTGISKNDLIGQPTINEVMSSFVEWSNNFILVSHNVKFDLEMIFCECYRCNISFDPKGAIDTIDLAKQIIPNKKIENYKLSTIKGFLGIDVKSHRAMNDCIVVSEIYLKYLDLKPELEKKEREKHQLNEKEIYVFKEIKSMLDKSGRDTSMLRGMILSNNILSICVFDELLRIKLRGKQNYILISKYIDYSNYDFSSLVKEPAKKSDNSPFRIIIDDISQIYFFEKYIIDRYDEAIKCNIEYISYFKTGKQKYESYLNNPYLFKL